MHFVHVLVLGFWGFRFGFSHFVKPWPFWIRTGFVDFNSSRRIDLLGKIDGLDHLVVSRG